MGKHTEKERQKGLLLLSLGAMVVILGLVSPGVKAANTQVNVMVPAYIYPSGNAWASLTAAAKALPNRVVAIANPNSGPGAGVNSDYTAAITALQAASGRAIGYVATTYGNRAIADVKADVDKWYSFYPSINGIFFDEAANTNGKQSYYQSLYNYVKVKSSSALVVNNPGTSTLETYLFYNGSRVVDVICTFESGVGALQWTQAAWTSKYDRSNFYGLFYNVTDINVSTFDYGDVIDRAYAQNAGWVFVTVDSLPNPWDSLPHTSLTKSNTSLATITSLN